MDTRAIASMTRVVVSFNAIGALGISSVSAPPFTGHVALTEEQGRVA